MNCQCKWNDNNEVISFCGAHYALHRKMHDPVEHKLDAILDYAKNQHPSLSSQSCPLCIWEWEKDDHTGFAKGKFIKACGYHYALDELRRIYTEDD